MVLNIGPQHPSTHGVLRLKLVLDGERVVSAEPIVGYMHRGAEKLFEVRDYRQITVLANRHDWLSAFSNELGVVMAVERMLGMEVPERAVWLRTLLAELNRVLNHLMFLGSFPLEMGAITPVFYAFRERETAAGGAGGGLRRADALHGEPDRRAEGGRAGRLDRHGCARPSPTSGCGSPADIDPLIRRNDIFLARTVGVGVLAPGHVRGVRGERSGRPRVRGRLRPAPGRALPRVRGAGRRAAGGDPHRAATATPASSACSSRCTRRSTSPTPCSTGCRRCPAR